MCVRVYKRVCGECSGIHFLNNGNLVSVPNLKKLMATKLGSCHGSKFPIPLIEKNNETLKRLSLLYFYHQSVLLFQARGVAFCLKLTSKKEEDSTFKRFK